MEFITYEVEGQIGIITINRPKALNALNSAVLDELDKTPVSYTHLTLPTNSRV